MRAVILSLDTGAYKAKADVAAAASLKRMLEQVGIEVRAAKAFPEDKEMLKTVLCKLADAGMVELVLPDQNIPLLSIDFGEFYRVLNHSHEAKYKLFTDKYGNGMHNNY